MLVWGGSLTGGCQQYWPRRASCEAGRGYGLVSVSLLGDQQAWPLWGYNRLLSRGIGGHLSVQCWML